MEDNKDTLDFFDQIIQRLSRVESGFEDNEMDKKIRLSKTDEDARTNARIEAMKSGKSFNEKDTPKEELSRANEKIIDELINRKINRLLGGE